MNEMRREFEQDLNFKLVMLVLTLFASVMRQMHESLLEQSEQSNFSFIMCTVYVWPHLLRAKTKQILSRILSLRAHLCDLGGVRLCCHKLLISLPPWN